MYLKTATSLWWLAKPVKKRLHYIKIILTTLPPSGKEMLSGAKLPTADQASHQLLDFCLKWVFDHFIWDDSLVVEIVNRQIKWVRKRVAVYVNINMLADWWLVSSQSPCHVAILTCNKSARDCIWVIIDPFAPMEGVLNFLLLKNHF